MKVAVITVATVVVFGIGFLVGGVHAAPKPVEPPSQECPQLTTDNDRYLKLQLQTNEILDETLECKVELLQCKQILQATMLDGEVGDG